MEVKFSKQSQKAIYKMDGNLKKRIRKAIEELPNGDVKILQNYNPKSFRLRVGKYRIIYRVVSEVLYITTMTLFGGWLAKTDMLL